MTTISMSVTAAADTPSDSSAGLALGLDVGGTKTHAVAVSDGVVVASLTAPTELGPAGVVTTIVRLARELTIRSGGRPITSVGVGIPGIVDVSAGTISNAVNLDIDQFPLAAYLATELNVPVEVDNDVNVAALGVAEALGGLRSLALLSMGTGLAAGVLLDGRLLRGDSGVAGEIGHLAVNPDGAACKCGQRGCLELELSGTSLRALADEIGEANAEGLFARAAAGDPAAESAVNRFIRRLVWAVHVLTLTFDPAMIAVTGGIASLGDTLLRPLVARLENDSAHSPFLSSLNLAERITIVGNGPQVAAHGAAMLGAHALSDKASQHG